jgi:hypothetical protein
MDLSRDTYPTVRPTGSHASWGLPGNRVHDAEHVAHTMVEPLDQCALLRLRFHDPGDFDESHDHPLDHVIVRSLRKPMECIALK